MGGPARTVLPDPPRPWRVQAARLCCQVRPTQLGVALKVALGLHREYVTTDDGLRFWVDPASHIGYQLANSRQYEPAMTALVKALVRPGDVFVDVGANEGYFSVVASHIADDVRVVAIEPQTRLAPVLLRNLELNGAHNVVTRAVALDGEDGWTRLYLRPSTNTGASGLLRRGRGNTSEMVMARTLDSVLDDTGVDAVRLLKVDCEGAEDRVVAGAGRALGDERVEYIAMEFHPTVGEGAVERSRALHDRLVGYGYVLSRTGELHVYHRRGGEAELAPLGAVATGVGPDLPGA